MAQVQYYGTGRRKSSVARVRLVPGEGRIVVNNREISEHIPSAALIEDIKQPLTLTETAGTYDVLVNVHGGGLSGQAGAIRHGIARALLEADPEYRTTLKRAGLLTRDARMKIQRETGRRRAIWHDARRRNGSMPAGGAHSSGKRSLYGTCGIRCRPHPWRRR